MDLPLIIFYLFAHTFNILQEKQGFWKTSHCLVFRGHGSQSLTLILTAHFRHIMCFNTLCAYLLFFSFFSFFPFILPEAPKVI